MRVLTYNIRKGKGPFLGGSRIDDLVTEVARRAADVVLCQEVFHSVGPDGPRQSERIATGLAHDARYGPNAIYERGHHGNATFTRHEIHASENHDLTLRRIEFRGVLYTNIRVGGRPIHVFNTHLGLDGAQRRRQVDSIAGIMASNCPESEGVILAGDFNDWSGGLDRRIRDRCGLTNALDFVARHERRSWPSPRPFLGLDRIYHRGLEVSQANVLVGDPWHDLSDHYPVEVVFDLE